MSSSRTRIDVMGVRLADFRTKVLPMEMHRGIIQPKGIMAGKLKGTIPAKTPTGSRYMTVSWPVETFIRASPCIRMGAPQATSTTSIALRMSPRASSRFFPSSVATDSVSSSRCFSRSARK